MYVPKYLYMTLTLQAFCSWAELPSLDQFEDWCKNDSAALLKSALAQESDASRQSWLSSAVFDPIDYHDLDTGDVYYEKGGTPLHVSARLGCINMTEALISYGADVNAKTEYDYTPLHKAAGHGSIEMMTLLLAHGSELDAQSVYPGRFTPLVSAAGGNHFEAVSFLLRLGAYPDSGDGKRAIHSAVRHANTAMVEELIKYNATVDTPDFMGETPLDLAEGENRQGIRQLLTQRQ